MRAPSDIGDESELRAIGGVPARAADRAPLVQGAARFAAVMAAAALHVAALALLVMAVQSTSGAGGTALDTIEVEVVEAAALAARDAVPAAIVTGAIAEVAATDGVPDTSLAKSVTPSATDAAPVLDAAPADRNAAPRTGDAAVPVLPEAAREEAPPGDSLPEEASASPAASSGANAGGAAAQMPQPTPLLAAAAVTGASPGDVRAYALGVAKALARSKPKAVGALGEARIRFTIASDGGLESLMLSRSSGSARLDAIALEAVRRARFNAPPVGFGLQERTFEVPYAFR